MCMCTCGWDISSSKLGIDLLNTEGGPFLSRLLAENKERETGWALLSAHLLPPFTILSCIELKRSAKYCLFFLNKVERREHSSSPRDNRAIHSLRKLLCPHLLSPSTATCCQPCSLQKPIYRWKGPKKAATGLMQTATPPLSHIKGSTREVQELVKCAVSHCPSWMTFDTFYGWVRMRYGSENQAIQSEESGNCAKWRHFTPAGDT